MYINDTIAAITTATGEAGVAIVRISGPQSLFIADQIVVTGGLPPSQRKNHSLCFGRIKKDKEILDEVLILIMKNPQSYTAEDVIEIQCHGGRISSKRILRLVLQQGARIARPGEFTERAFLNGKIDLLQAEAVLDLIHARTERAAATAIDQLEGGLSRIFHRLYDQLLAIVSDIEATLDFSEEDIEPLHSSEVEERINAVSDEVKKVMATYDEGRMLREGASVVILGRPNAGKSTLLNALLESDRAIVSHIPGTTRDIIEEGIVLDGVPLRLIDTAGLRDAECDIEAEGIRRTHERLARADYILFVRDCSICDSQEEIMIAGLDPEKTIIIANKVDLIEYKPLSMNGIKEIKTILKERKGVDEIRLHLTDMIDRKMSGEESDHAVVSERHYRVLGRVEEELKQVHYLIKENQLDGVLASSHIRQAMESIAEITGKSFHEDLLGSIFSKFCVGK